MQTDQTDASLLSLVDIKISDNASSAAGTSLSENHFLVLLVRLYNFDIVSIRKFVRCVVRPSDGCRAQVVLSVELLGAQLWTRFGANRITTATRLMQVCHSVGSLCCDGITSSQRTFQL